MSVLAVILALTVSVASLLDEMTDRDAVTYAPAYRARLSSSHDRSNVHPDLPGWFSNFDRNEFLFRDFSHGRVEQVMVDATGPGVVTRFWLVTNNEKTQGTLRIYLDGELAAEGPCLDLVGAGVLAPVPLSSALPQADCSLRSAAASAARPAGSVRRVKQGNNLYLPLPYAKSCRITYEDSPDNPYGWFYYNVETREYGKGEEVEKWNGAEVGADLQRAAHVLAQGCGDALPEGTRIDTVELALKPGEGAERTFGGPAAVRALTIEMQDERLLQDLTLELIFDGRMTASVPVGGLFGAGRVAAPHETRFTKIAMAGAAAEGGRSTDSPRSAAASAAHPPLLLHCRHVMPFARQGRVRFVNVGTNALAAAVSVAVGPYLWEDGRSMHFGATARRFDKVKVSPAEARDLTLAELEGEGVIVGTCLSVNNRSTSWWGEGDEKVFVDGEVLPSYVGTGSEDYFGFAHSSARTFSHPFLAQSVGEGAYPKDVKHLFKAGAVECSRFRSLDAIPFRSRCRFDLEVLDEGGGELDLLATTLWYAREKVKDEGQDRRLIVLSDSEAAREFVKYAKLMTGKDVSVVTEDDVRSDLVRFELRPSGAADCFSIRSAAEGSRSTVGGHAEGTAERSETAEGRRSTGCSRSAAASAAHPRTVLTFSGSDDRCLLSAVYTYFERHGCRWFRDRERVPRIASLQMTGWDVRSTARFRHRVIVCKGTPPDGRLLAKLRINEVRESPVHSSTSTSNFNSFVLPAWNGQGVRANYDAFRKDLARAALDPSVDTIVLPEDFLAADELAVRFFSESAWDPGVADILPQFLRRFCFDRYGDDQPKVEPRWHAALARGLDVDE